MKHSTHFEIDDIGQDQMTYYGRKMFDFDPIVSVPVLANTKEKESPRKVIMKEYILSNGMATKGVLLPVTERKRYLSRCLTMMDTTLPEYI